MGEMVEVIKEKEEKQSRNQDTYTDDIPLKGTPMDRPRTRSK
jgi:hypothetical protein